MLFLHRRKRLNTLFPPAKRFGQVAPRSSRRGTSRNTAYGDANARAVAALDGRRTAPSGFQKFPHCLRELRRPVEIGDVPGALKLDIARAFEPRTHVPHGGRRDAVLRSRDE